MERMGISFKKCKKCGETKPDNKFSTMGKKKQHLTLNTCNRCLYLKNREYLLARQKRLRVKKYRFKWKTASEQQKLDRLKLIFEKHAVKNPGICWDWNGKLHNTGYAVINFENKQMRAHRASWILHNGKIDKNLCILHRCDCKFCTNPEHLFLGTNKENTLDMLNKGRAGVSKLSASDIKTIRELIKLEVPISKIARKFKVRRRSILSIKANKYWKHVK